MDLHLSISHSHSRLNCLRPEFSFLYGNLFVLQEEEEEAAARSWCCDCRSLSLDEIDPLQLSIDQNMCAVKSADSKELSLIFLIAQVYPCKILFPLLHIDECLKQYLLKHDVKIFQSLAKAGVRLGKELICKESTVTRGFFGGKVLLLVTAWMRLHFIKICISHVSLIKLQRRLIHFNFQFCEGVYDRYDTLHNIGFWTALVCQYCKLGQLDEVTRLLCDVIKLCFSPPITDNGFLNGNIGEENLSAVDRSEKLQVNSETVLEEIWTDGNHEVLLKL